MTQSMSMTLPHKYSMMPKIFNLHENLQIGKISSYKSLVPDTA